jgi:TolB-like protein
MRTMNVSILLVFISFGALFGLPKVAVLDAVLPAKMDKEIAIGITDKISEELVATGKFMVLDRNSIALSLKEIEFQMSGIVSDAEIQKAGQRLGAAYIVVARVSFVEGTYFISAKMINVQTGEIAVQASDEDEGKASVTLKIAKRVGVKLAGGTVVVEEKKGKEITSSINSTVTTSTSKETKVISTKNETKNAASDQFDPLLTLDGHEYLISKQPYTWKEASELCKKSGGHLAAITSAAENTAIVNAIKTKEIDRDIWIGLTSERLLSKFEWVTGENLKYRAPLKTAF